MTDQDDPTGMARLLAGLRETGPMPEDLVQRIRTSLDEEQVAREDASATDDPDDNPSGGAGAEGEQTPFWEGLADADEPPDEPRRNGPRRRTGRWVLAGAAGLVGVAAVGSLAVNQFGGEGESSGDAAAQSAAQSPATTATTGTSGDTPPFVITRTGTDYTQSDFGQQAEPLTNGPGGIKGEPDEELVGTLTTAAGTRDCLARLGRPELIPVAVDIATFEGTPGLAIVAELPPEGEAKAFAVTKGCEPIWEGPTEVSGS